MKLPISSFRCAAMALLIWIPLVQAQPAPVSSCESVLQREADLRKMETQIRKLEKSGEKGDLESLLMKKESLESIAHWDRQFCEERLKKGSSQKEETSESLSGKIGGAFFTIAIVALLVGALIYPNWR